MITDASVKGLKMLAYTKEAAFAKIFAPAGININISVYASEVNGEILEDGMQGADWNEAIALRNQYENVGITLVATNDRIVEWGLSRPEVDVVIPYHLVRTGQEVADYFGFQNYTKESSDGKLKLDDGEKRKVSSVYPTMHNNDLVQYVQALQKYKLTPRFERYLTGWREFLSGEMSEADFRAANPYYMKLVNETRRTAVETQPVQPIFNTEAAIDAIDLMERRGGYGIAEVFGRFWKDTIEDATDELAEKIHGKAQYSQRTLSDGTRYVALDGNLFMRSDGTEMSPREAYRSLIGMPIILSDGDVITLVDRLPGGTRMYEELFKRWPRFEKGLDMKVLNNEINRNIIETLVNSSVVNKNVPDYNGRHTAQSITHFDTRTVNISDDNGAYTLTLSIATLTDGSKIGYAKKEIANNALLWEKIKKETGRGQSSSVQNPSGNSVSQNATNSNSQSQKSDREIDLHDAQDITDMRTGYDPVEAKVSRSPCTGSGIFGLSRINFT